MKLLQGRSDVFNRRSSGDDTNDCVLYQLEFVKRFPQKTKEERVIYTSNPVFVLLSGIC